MTLDHIKSRQYKLQSETVRKRLEDIKKRPILLKVDSLKKKISRSGGGNSSSR